MNDNPFLAFNFLSCLSKWQAFVPFYQKILQLAIIRFVSVDKDVFRSKVEVRSDAT